MTTPPAIDSRKFTGKGNWRLACVALAAVGWLAMNGLAGTVYETPTEFFTSGDFNGDGIRDVLVLDKSTGNARVGYQDGLGNLSWSQPLVTGVENATGCATGALLVGNLDAVAVTAAELNRVNLVDLSNTNSAGSPVVVTPPGIGPHSLAALTAPMGTPPSPLNFLLVASSFNPPPGEELDLLDLNSSGAAVGQFNETGSFDRPNALQLDTNGPTLAAGIVRGTNDTLDIWQFTNSPDVLVALSNLPPGSDYALGVFNGEALPRFVLYQPGQSNVIVVALLQTNTGFFFGPALPVTLAEAVQQIVYVSQGTDGSFQINFGDGIQGMTLPNGAASLSAIYPVGGGSAFTGAVPLGNGNFALLDAPIGSTTSVHAQVVKFNGTNYTKISSGNLPAITANSSRANVWLFQAEPFVNQSPGFIESLNAPDWSVGIGGLPGAVAVSTEADGGPTPGLSTTPATNNLGAPPAGSLFALPNQYSPVISIYSYSSPRAVEPVNVTISPPPGTYSGPIQVSFRTLNLGDTVFYSTSSADTWHQYGSSFTLTYDSTVRFFGTNAASTTRSRLQSATYVLGNNGPPSPPLNLNTNGSTNKVPATINTNAVILSGNGTVFYGRRSGNTGSIWCINLDGSGETYITSGARPRISRDGHWLAFLRDGNPFANQGNLWLRDLVSGDETLLFTNTSTIVFYDWDITGTNLIFDYNCLFYEITPGGALTQLPLASACSHYAPSVNPLDGRLAFFSVDIHVRGIFETTPDRTSAQLVGIGSTDLRWPEWSPDGLSLVISDGNSTLSVDGGKDLYVANADGTDANQITEFTDITNGFPHGAMWTSDGGSLVGAGTIYGTNGIWVIPLTADHTSCDCEETLVPLPVSAGDPIDFVGSVLSAPPTVVTNHPGLFIRQDPTNVVVYWSTNYQSYSLQSTTDLANRDWTPITGPYYLLNGNYEYRLPQTNLLDNEYFRLNLTGAIIITTDPTNQMQ